MADSSIVTKISGDASGLVAALEQAKQGVTNFGSAAANILERKLGLKDVFKGVLQGIGIASVQQIAEKLTAPFKDAAESAEKLERYSQGAADATERLIRLRQDDNQQLETLIKKQARLQKEAEDAANSPARKKFFGFIERGSAIDKIFGLSSGDDQKRSENAAKVTQALQEAALETETKKLDIKKKSEDLSLKTAREELANADKLAAAKEKLAEFELAKKREAMSAEEKIVSLSKEKRAVEEEIAKYAKFTREGGELNLTGVNDLLGLKEKQLALEKDIAAETAKKANAETMIGETIVSNIAEWEKFKGIITNTGRGDGELSDKELERKITNIRSDIFSRQVGVRAQTAAIGMGTAGGYDALLGPQQMNLKRAQDELEFRNKVRTYTATFGADAAFNMFPGLSEQKFAQINNTSTQLDKVVDRLEKIDRRLSGGIPTLSVGAINGGG